MYDRYCNFLDYNNPQKVIQIIEDKISNNVADITDYKVLYSLYIHVLDNDLAEKLILAMSDKFGINPNDYYYVLKNFKGQYDTLWKILKTKGISTSKSKKQIASLFKLKNIFRLKSLEDIDNLIIFKQAGIGDEIIFSRWYKDLIPHVKKDIFYIGNNSPNHQVFIRNFEFLKEFNYSPKHKYHTISSFGIPDLLKVGCNIPNQKYLYADQNLISNYLPKEKFRVGLCHHGNFYSKLRGILTIPRNKIVDMIGKRAEIVNLYYGGLTYVKGKTSTIGKELRHPDIKYLKLDNYEDLLATIETCDVVISCDTSVAHAAGAMGKKTFVLCNGRLYFPWFIEGNVGKSRFYEDVTVVKQFQPASWEISVDKVVNELIQYK